VKIAIDNNIDDRVDAEIQEAVKARKSFFMYAGAGSGKTRSLVNLLKYIAAEEGYDLSSCSKQVAVITYTNAACDEILSRIGYNRLFAVSTIHSFLWELIKPFQKDIKKWLISKIEEDISKLEEEQKNPRTRKDRTPEINKKKERLLAIKNIHKFTYNPNGENTGKASLDHADVIKMGSQFIHRSTTMQNVLIDKFPILLIDESQDTKKELVDALLEVSQNGQFVIGMFGDTMQRIYSDGKEDLSANIPDGWSRPFKVMNHRSNKRIIQLANTIRSTIDKVTQDPRAEKVDGFVRIFIVSSTADKSGVEKEVYENMAKITADNLWKDAANRKTLVLEHSMAATRLGFVNIDKALGKVFSQSFRDGMLSELSFLMNVVYPIVQAKQSGDAFAVMKIWRNNSSLLKSEAFFTMSDQSELLGEINNKIDDLTKLWGKDKDPTCLEVYQKLVEIDILELPKRIQEVLIANDESSDKIKALKEGLQAPFSELLAYWSFVNDKTQFSTHQGIKGLEFPRVAVIMDDESAGGFLFSYEKLFGAKKLTDTDLKNEKEGKDSTISRTLRLFYVTCTRAIESLALIAYSADVNAVKNTVLKNGWFNEDEVIVLGEKQC